MTAVPALEVRNAGMTFPALRALRGVDLTIGVGEVHALVGHNGSGKSTLIKILSGHNRPDPGTSVKVAGRPLRFGDPRSTAAVGIRVVHQNLALVDTVSVTENVALGVGYGPGHASFIPWRGEHERVRRQLRDLGYDIDPRAPLGEISPAEKTAVAIARALSDRPRQPVKALVLDEVTSTMPRPEVERLLALVTNLRQSGVAVLYVTHHLEEVFEVADRVTVLRDGELVATAAARQLDVSCVADLIVGEAEPRRAPARRAAVRAVADGKQILEVKAVSGARVRDFSLVAGRGEVIGIAGLTGSGREELASLLFGAAPRGGEVIVDGATVPALRPRASLRAGMAFVPGNRERSAVIGDLCLRENMTISRLPTVRHGGWLDGRAEREEVGLWLDRLSIRARGTEDDIDTLSGGNRQKVILARCLRLKPKVLVLEEPTQGVDIGAVVDVHGTVREIAAEAVVLLVSSDTSELAALSTRVLILRGGRIAGRLDGAEISEDSIDRLQLAPAVGETAA